MTDPTSPSDAGQINQGQINQGQADLGQADLGHPLDAATAQRFSELAALGQALLTAEAQLAQAGQDNIALRQENSRLQRQVALARDSGPGMADSQEQLDALSTKVAQLTQAVAQKEQARFAQQEESWALAEALNTQLEYPAGAAAPSVTGYIQDTVRLTELLRQAETRAQDSKTRILELTRQLSEQQGQTWPSASAALAPPPAAAGPDLTELRVAQTRLMAQRDHALMQVRKPAFEPGYPNLATPSQGHVFVVSYGMSGDVELQSLINRLDGVCLRGENGGVIGPVAAAWNQAQAAAGAAGFDDLNRLGWHLAETLSATVLTPEQPLRWTGFREIRWPGAEADFHGALDFLHGFFPNARFVFHSRDPETVAGLGWWAEQPRDDVLSNLQRRCAMFNAYLTEHPDRGIHLRHDSYRAEPDQLQALFDLLQTPYQPRLVKTWLKETRP